MSCDMKDSDSHSDQMFWHIAVLRKKKKVSDALRILTISNILMKYMFCFFWFRGCAASERH